MECDLPGTLDEMSNVGVLYEKEGIAFTRYIIVS